MYTDYCASCHGQDGKGNVPAAALKAAPANLALLAKNNGGKYPAEHVAAILSFGVEKNAHGNKEMPVRWPTLRIVGWELKH